MQPKKIPRWLPFAILLFVALSAWRMWPAPRATDHRSIIRFAGQALGTSYHISVVGEVRAASAAVAQEELDRRFSPLEENIRAVLADVDRRMSTWRADSEVSRFNAWRSTEPFEVSPQTAEVVRTALRLAVATEGAFDITMAPLLRLWGFGHGATPRALRGGALPDRAALAEAAQLVGPAMVTAQGRMLSKRRGGVHMDLSAIAKGYSVDRLAAALEVAGVRAYMVEVGGEIRVRGRNEAGQPWRIGVQTPDPAQLLPGPTLAVLALEHDAVATSGDYRNFYDVAGKRYSHTIDPRTRKPVSHGLTSVTVVAEECMLADAWATALMVLGPEAGQRLADHHHVAALFVVREAAGLRQSMSPSFARRFAAVQGTPP